ncbi:zinc-binding dehydrogenase [Subtercola sp. Z020]|uniref:zinc-dependent alcohol dehydrogenase n=1 Tax=Subtercola sp. Z020 TaxID=2080582 RepID=UPI00130D59A0|nr:alcohol dehydrogenase catalytic domain-containing protein [Subtercola sp. Z020]
MSAAAPRAGGRVVELVAERSLDVVEREVPEPGPGEARVRIRAVGICGTDVHGYLGRSDRLPMTLGHDAVGIVDALGADADAEHGTADDVTPAVTVGDRVTIDPTVRCGVCGSCRAGLPQVCSGGGYLGMTATGTMADYLTVPVGNLVPVADGVSDVAATVLEPIAVALHLLDRVGAFSPPARIAHVIGGGPLGVLLGQTLGVFGWAVTVHEPQAYRRIVAASAGLSVAEPGQVTPDSAPVLIVETSATAPGVQLARTLATPGSTIGLVGRAPADFTSAEILLKELSVLGVRAGVGQYPAAIDLVARGLVTPLITVSHEFALDAASEAFAAVTDPAREVMRAVLLAEPTPERSTEGNTP